MNKKARSLVKKMLDFGLIRIVGKINVDMLEMVKYAISELYFTKTKSVMVVISSPGGDSVAAMEIYDLLRLYPGEVTGLVIGSAMSSAAIILQGCTKRLATPNSRLLIHNGSCSIDVDT